MFFELFIFAINLWHRKFITADVTAVFANNQHDIQRQGADFDKNINTQHTQYSRRGIKIGAPKMEFICVVFDIC